MQTQQFLAQQIFKAPTELELEQCCLLLQTTYKSNNDQERVQAEELLNEISKDSQKFLELLISIIISPNAKIEDKTKESAATYTNHMLKNQAVRATISPQQKLLQMNIIYQAMITDGLKLNLRHHLGTTLKGMLETELGDELKTLLFPIVVESLASSSSGTGALIALQCITHATTNGIKLAQIFQDSAKNMIALADHWIDPILMELSALALSLSNSSPDQIDQKVNKIIERLQSLTVWIETFLQFVSKLKDKTGDLLKHVIVHDAIALVLIKLLCLHIQTSQQVTDTIISTSGLKKFDDLLNEIKVRVMRVLNRLVIFMLLKKHELPTIPTSKFYSITQNILQLCLSTIIKFCKSDLINLSKAITDTSIECFMAEMLSFLTEMAKQPETYYLFAENRQELVLYVIFPLLRTMDSEKELLIDNPSDFVQLAIDTCEKQTSQTVKTNCAAFMETLCDRIDGTVTLVSMFAFSLIEFSLESDKLEDIPTKFVTLGNSLQSSMLTKTPANIRVETSLIVLSVLSYIIQGRADLMALIEKMVTQYKQFFFKTPDILISNRFVLLISFYYEYIFKKDTAKDEFAAITIYLITAIGLAGENQGAISLQAIDGLKAIINDEEVSVRLEPYVNDVLEKLSEYVVVNPHNEFFDIIQEYVKIYVTELTNQNKTIIKLVKMLVTRIESELGKLQGTTEKTNLTLNKCWNIIRAIGEEKKYFPALQEELEQALLPVLKYMEHPEKMDFDDDIIYFLDSVMANSEKVSPITFTLTQTFPKIFAKYRSTLGLLYQCMNHILVYGKEDIKKVPTVLDLIIGLSCEAISTKSEHPNEANRSDGALLIHVAFQYYADMIDSKQRQMMLLTALEALDAGVKHAFYRARLYGIILHGFMFNYETTEEFLVSKGVLSAIVHQMLENIANFKANYDKKVFVIGFSSVLMQEKLNEGISKYIIHIFDSVITMLKIIQAIEQATIARTVSAQENPSTKQSYQNRLQNNNYTNQAEDEIPDDDVIMKKFLNDFQDKPLNQKVNSPQTTSLDNDFEDEDENDSSDDDGPSLNEGEEDEQETSINLLITYFKKRDEFGFFRDIVFKIRELNHDGLLHIINKLPMPKQNYLKHVLQSYRISLDDSNQSTRARKIVTVKGKKDKNAFPDKDNEMSDK